MPRSAAYSHGRRISYPPPPDPLRLPGLDRLLARSELRFVSADEWESPAPWQIRRRSLATANWSSTRRGTLRYEVEGDAFEVGPGDFVLLPPNAAHAVTLVAGEVLEGRSGHFLWTCDGVDLIAALGLPRRLVRERELGRVASELAREHNLALPGARRRCEGLLWQLLLHILRRHGSACRPRVANADELASMQGLDAAHRLLVASAHDPTLRIEDLAAAARMSVGRLRVHWRRRFGCAPVRSLQQHRLARASELLLRSDRSVESIAAEVGFVDAAYFHRVFKSRIGTTPRRFRERRGGD